jgi:DNA-binding NtrC family response regulator
MAYAWPGNIRELKNVVERLVFSVAAEEVDATDIPLEVRQPRPAAGGGTFAERIDALEREMLERGLAEAGGNQKKAAAILGLTYDQFRHYYKKHGIKARAAAEAGE